MENIFIMIQSNHTNSQSMDRQTPTDGNKVREIMIYNMCSMHYGISVLLSDFENNVFSVM